MGRSKLSEAALNRCNIFYDSQPSSLPPHIEDLRSNLLDFDCTVFGDLGELDVDLDCEQLGQKFRWRSECEALLKKVGKSTKKAVALTARQDRESEWQEYYSKSFCKRFIKAAEIKDSDDRRTARAKFYYEHFETAIQRHWTLFSQKNGYQSAKRKSLSKPIPDWMVAFPVYSANYFTTLDLPQKWLWTAQPKDAMVTNLSSKTLQHLIAYGLYSTLADSAQKQKCQTNFKLSDHMCFPWLVMEHKKDKHSTEHCYCQTANATSAAILLLENLCTHENPSHLNLHIPPVIGITTVGSEVKVWLTYSTPSCIKMDCIWTGDTTKPVIALQLHHVFENIHSWATRVLRPRLSLHIDQWLIRHPFGSPIPPRDEAAKPRDQLTPRRQNVQNGLQGNEQDTRCGDSSPTLLGDIFNNELIGDDEDSSRDEGSIDNSEDDTCGASRDSDHTHSSSSASDKSNDAEHYQDQGNIMKNSEDDTESTPVLPRGNGLPRPTTPTLTGSTFIASAHSDKSYIFDYRPRREVWTETPTKSSNSLQPHLPPLRLKPFPTASMQPSRQSPQVSLNHLLKRATNKMKFVRVRLPRPAVSGGAVNPPHKATKKIITQQPEQPTVTSKENAEDLFPMDIHSGLRVRLPSHTV